MLFFWSFSGWGAALLTGGLEHRATIKQKQKQKHGVEQKAARWLVQCAQLRPAPGSSLSCPPVSRPSPWVFWSCFCPHSPRKSRSWHSGSHLMGPDLPALGWASPDLRHRSQGSVSPPSGSQEDTWARGAGFTIKEEPKNEKKEAVLPESIGQFSDRDMPVLFRIRWPEIMPRCQVGLTSQVWEKAQRAKCPGHLCHTKGQVGSMGRKDRECPLCPVL